MDSSLVGRARARRHTGVPTMDPLPDHLVEQSLLPVVDTITLFRLAKTCRALRSMICAHISSHCKAKGEVMDAIWTLGATVKRDRSGRFRHVFGGVFHHWFFHTRLEGHCTWIYSPERRYVGPHPRPFGHERWWCLACGGTLACPHAPQAMES